MCLLLPCAELIRDTSRSDHTVQNMILRSEESPTLPLLAIEYAMPGSHRCQCEICLEKHASQNQRERAREGKLLL